MCYKFFYFPVALNFGSTNSMFGACMLRPGSEYLALRPEVNVNVRPKARIELGSILAFVMRLH